MRFGIGLMSTPGADQSVFDALVAHKVSLRIFLFALVAQVAHDVQFNYADAFKGAVCV